MTATTTAASGGATGAITARRRRWITLSVMLATVMQGVDTTIANVALPHIQGGLSGPAIRPIAVLKTWQVYQEARKHGIPIIGQGGIVSARDALEFIIAGATAIGVGTALFYDPLACRKINAGLAEHLDRNRIGRLSDLVGSLAPATVAAGACG